VIVEGHEDLASCHEVSCLGDGVVIDSQVVKDASCKGGVKVIEEP
jgi:hypothetical protein